MAIDFFQPNCTSSSNALEFGLCDDPPPSNSPAYIDEIDLSKWIGIVRNSKNKEVTFTAIDACIDIRRENGFLEKRCDGLLSYENILIFVELKCREGGQWVKKGREQLTVTIRRFQQNYNTNDYDEISCNICNSLRPISNTGHAANIQQFFDDTGFTLKTDRVIII